MANAAAAASLLRRGAGQRIALHSSGLRFSDDYIPRAEKDAIQAPFCAAAARRAIGYNSGYTGNVKTAVSVPDDLFRMADAAARRLRVSRSKLYATAISEFLNRQQGGAVTERLNEVYSRRPAKLDPVLRRAQLRSLEKDSW